MFVEEEAISRAEVFQLSEGGLGNVALNQLSDATHRRANTAPIHLLWLVGARLIVLTFQRLPLRLGLVQVRLNMAIVAANFGSVYGPRLSARQSRVVDVVNPQCDADCGVVGSGGGGCG